MSGKSKQTSYKMRYGMAHGGGIIVVLPYDPRNHKCDACGKSIESGEIRVTALHHWRYQYAPKTVKDHPEFALKNTSELCFGCHQIADGLRAILTANPSRVVNVISVLPQEQRERLIKIFKLVIEMWIKKDEIIKESPAVNELGKALGFQ